MTKQDTFHCDFGGGVSCTVKLDVAAFQKHKAVADVLKIEWEGERSLQILPQYVEWMHDVLMHVSERINGRILYAFPGTDGTGFRYYAYYPEGRYERFIPPTKQT